MPSFGKILGACALALPMILGACKPNRGTASPEDYYALIKLSLDGGQIAAMIGRNEAIKAKSFAGCVVADVLASAFDSAEQGLSAKMVDAPEIPGFELDLADCMALKPVPAETNVCEPEAVEGASEAPASETSETSPASEPAPVEDAAVAVSKDDLALFESIAGVAIVAATHYAKKLQATDCRKGTLALAAIAYVGGMAAPALAEIEAPDGKFSVPAVAVDLSACKAS